MKKVIGWIVTGWLGAAAVMTLANQLNRGLGLIWKYGFKSDLLISLFFEMLGPFIILGVCVFIVKRYLVERKDGIKQLKAIETTPDESR